MDTQKEELVKVLYNAYSQNELIAEEDVPGEIDKSTAYEIQHKVTKLKSKIKDDKLIGYKISLTSKETQNMFKSSTPLYGSLTNTDLSDGNIQLDEMHAPLIEVELMFIANEHLTKADDEASILQKMSIAPGLEIPDSRFLDWFPNLSFGQVIADSAVAGKIVVGDPVNGLTYEQLGNVNANLTLDGKTIAEGPSSEVLDNPVHAVKWLIDELAESDRIIEAGMVISSGTFILPKKLKKGKFEANFDGIGSISAAIE